MTHDRDAQDEGAEGLEREIKFLVDGDTLMKALAAPAFGGGAPPVWRKLKTMPTQH